jgi:hypothetical protein
MTCIIGLIDQKSRGVYIGGDSAGTNDAGQQSIRLDSKVFRNGALLFGGTGSFRMIQLLRYRLIIPDYRPSAQQGEDPLFRYLATDFIDAVRSCFKDGGYAKKESERETGGFFLVAVQGRLFCVQRDYQVEEVALDYHAVGSGDDVAFGALHATHHLDLSPEHRIRLALEAASYHYSNVRPPFVIEKMEYVKEEASGQGLSGALL